MRELISASIRQLVNRFYTAAPVAPVNPANPATPEQAPNYTPEDIFSHVQTEVLKTVGLKEILFESAHSLIVPNKVKGNNSLYQLTFRRKAIIDEDVNERIKRLRDTFNFIGRDPKSSEMILQVWAPPMQQTELD
jgi:hypothetical protein